jgi:phage tail tube protein FII
MRNIIFKLVFLVLTVTPLLLSAQTTATSTSQTPVKKQVKKKKVAKKATSSTNATTTSTQAPKPEVLAMPVMTFKTKKTDFGNIKMGDKPVFTYEFTNTGTQPLDIELVDGCSCTELDWTRTTVKPGEKGFIKALYNTLKAEPEDHKKPLDKSINVVLKQRHPKTDYALFETLTFKVMIID